MCGHIQRVQDNPLVRVLLKELGIDISKSSLHAGDFYPGGKIDGVILETEEGRQMVECIWWFLLDLETGKPNYQYATFNARHLDNRMWKEPLKYHRCAVIATGIGESKGEGSHKASYLMQSEEPILLGGLYRPYYIGKKRVYGLSIITRDPHPRFSQYHDKAIPLFLPTDKDFLDAWLDPNFLDVHAFDEVLLYPKIRSDFRVTPVQSTKKLMQVGEPEILKKDDDDPLLEKVRANLA